MCSKLIGPVFGKLVIPTSLVRLNLSVVEQMKPSRYISSNQFQEKWTLPKKNRQHYWSTAISKAERMVGCSTSFLSLPWILSNELATFVPYLRKLAGSNHTLLRTGKYIIYNGKNTLQLWNLIILLISKSAGYASDIDQEKRAEIFHSQRVLAEITEMLQISHWIHQSIVNLHLVSKAGEGASLYDDMVLGNKISVLCGDSLLSHVWKELAYLKNPEVQELLYSAFRGLVESEFIGERDEENNPLPSNPLLYKVERNDIVLDKDWDTEVVMGVPEKEWEFRNIFGAGRLLGKSCQGALNLAEQPKELQMRANLVGKHFALAWQAHLDAKPFQISTLPIGETFSMISAPVLFHLEYDSSLYAEIEKGKTSVDNINYEKIHSEVLGGPGLERTKILQNKHAKAAMDALETFPPSDVRTGLQNIIQAMQDL